MTELRKKIHTELKGILTNRFELIKASLGIQNDAEVVRFLIQYYYQQRFQDSKTKAKEEVDADRFLIKEFMDKYGEEWRKLGED